MKSVVRLLRFTPIAVAAVSFAVLPGCGTEEGAGGASELDTPADVASLSSDGSAGHDHDHEGHDHDHEGHDHDHEGHDHDHEGHDHDHEGHDHDHEGHDHDHAGHDHDAKPMDATVKEIESLYLSIKAGMEKDDIEAAHDPLHSMGGVLVAAEETLKKQGDAADAKAVKAVDTLLDKFSAIDEGLHGSEGVKFADVQKEIEQAIATLKGVSP